MGVMSKRKGSTREVSREEPVATDQPSAKYSKSFRLKAEGRRGQRVQSKPDRAYRVLSSHLHKT